MLSHELMDRLKRKFYYYGVKTMFAITGLVISIRSWYNMLGGLTGKNDRGGFRLKSCDIYRFDDIGQLHIPPENQQLCRLIEDMHTGPCYGPDETFSFNVRVINQFIQQLKESERYFISVSYTFDDQEYCVVFRKRIDFPPYDSEYIMKKRRTMGRRRFTQAIAENSDASEAHDVTEFIQKYAGPLGDFYASTVEDTGISVRHNSLWDLGMHDRLHIEDVDFHHLRIKDNRGNEGIFHANDPISLPNTAKKND